MELFRIRYIPDHPDVVDYYERTGIGFVEEFPSFRNQLTYLVHPARVGSNSDGLRVKCNYLDDLVELYIRSADLERVKRREI